MSEATRCWPRRRVLEALVAGTGQIVLSAAPDAGGLRSDPALPDMIASLRAARAVGRKYLAANPEEANPAVLRGLLGPLCGTAPSGRPRLSAVRRAEFARGDTVIVDGWILARCEARCCALVALS